MKSFLIPLLKCPVRQCALLVMALSFTLSAESVWTADPLPSGQNRDAWRKIIEYIENVTDSETDQFISVAERVSVFDNDGTLWCQSPLPIHLASIIDEVKKQVKENIEFRKDPTVAALLKSDIKGALAMVWMGCCGYERKIGRPYSNSHSNFRVG